MQQQASLASRQQLFSLVSFGRCKLTPLFSSNPAPLIGDVHIVLFYCSVSCSPLGSTTVNHLLQSWKKKRSNQAPPYLHGHLICMIYIFAVGFITLDTFLTEASAYIQTRLIQHFIVVHPERNVTLEQRGGPINRPSVLTADSMAKNRKTWFSLYRICSLKNVIKGQFFLALFTLKECERSLTLSAENFILGMDVLIGDILRWLYCGSYLNHYPEINLKPYFTSQDKTSRPGPSLILMYDINTWFVSCSADQW